MGGGVGEPMKKGVAKHEEPLLWTRRIFGIVLPRKLPRSGHREGLYELWYVGSHANRLYSKGLWLELKRAIVPNKMLEDKTMEYNTRADSRIQHDTIHQELV